MNTMTPELRRVVDEVGHARIEDPETGGTYILLKADAFERMQELHHADDDAVSAMYPMLADLSPEDWEDASQYGL